MSPSPRRKKASQFRHRPRGFGQEPPGYRSPQTNSAKGRNSVTMRKLAGAAAASAMMIGLGVVPQAWATSNIKELGVEETVKDINGPLIGYTVTGLMPSGDPVAFPVAGRLYEATVRANALVGTVTPAPNLFNARAENGDNYPALPVSSIGGPVGQGGSTTGKVYFDVVGTNPNSVVFNNGFEDILGWIQPPGISPAEVAPPASGGGEGESGGGAEGSMGSTGPNQSSPTTSGGEIGGEEGGTEGGGGNLDSGGGSGAPSGDTG